MKSIIKRILPKPVLDVVARRLGYGMTSIDLSLVNLIRQKDLHYLSNSQLLERELLPQLGLNNELSYEFPEELYPFCGHGLCSWQYPNQFSKYLVQLSKFEINTYLEIGVRHGGTFVITVEYLERFHPLESAIGVDIVCCPSLIKYKKRNPKIDFLQVDSQSAQFKEFVRSYPGFDLVFIDGSHEETACKNDFETVKGKANIIVLHDIVDNPSPGVVRVWNQLRAMYADEYQFFEYTDQYKSVGKRRPGQTFMGIGMAVRKEYAMRHH